MLWRAGASGVPCREAGTLKMGRRQLQAGKHEVCQQCLSMVAVIQLERCPLLAPAAATVVRQL